MAAIRDLSENFTLAGDIERPPLAGHDPTGHAWMSGLAPRDLTFPPRLIICLGHRRQQMFEHRASVEIDFPGNPHARPATPWVIARALWI